ncbi:MAG: tRNA lysidine(34) synthetase TilS [Selenomonas sp.]|nr:tRNA lysidine(34) synthetase TilS [Selenomonas sp.]
MLEIVEQFCRKNRILPPGARILAACSGGADSVALLYILWRLRSRYGWQVAAAHYEHGIRGRQSEEDAAFVRDLCAQWQIPCFVENGDVPAFAREQGYSLEQAARIKRYEFLQRICKEQGLEVIALGHHADDQAETVLMRILRGTGITGLAAMRPVSGQLVRPLLGVAKEQILRFCQQEGLPFRQDATNFVADCTRNRLRLELIPLLRQGYNPEVERGLCQLAAVAAEADDFISGEVARLWADSSIVRPHDYALRQEALQNLHPALVRGIIRRWWAQVTGSSLDLSYRQTELLRDLLQEGTTGSRQELSHGYVARLQYGFLLLQRGAAEPAVARPVLPLLCPGSAEVCGYTVHARWVEPMAVNKSTGPGELYLAPEVFSGQLVWRSRMPGDFMELPQGHKKLKKLLIDDKVPQHERDNLLLLAAGKEVVWVVGRRRSAKCLPDDYAYNEARKCPPPQQVGARIPKQAASISPTSLKRQEEVLPMAKLEQRRYKESQKILYIKLEKRGFYHVT